MSLSNRINQLPPILAIEYEAQQKLAASPGKATWLATDRKTGKSVVIKLLFFDQHFDWQHHKLFEREAQVLQHLSHPSLPRLINSINFQDETSNGFASVQSYIPGTSLSQYIQQGRTFSEFELKELAEKVLEILEFLHSRNPSIIHRDIKPSNILLGDRSANSIGQVFLVDFDAVQTTITPGSTRTVVGSYGYMPPEQFGGQVVPASDLYALGATLIAVATGQHPADLPQTDLKIQFEPLVQMSPGLCHWINRCVEPSLDARFSSARDAQRALKSDNFASPARTVKLLKKPPEKTSVDYIEYEQSEHRLSVSIFSSLYDRARFTVIVVSVLLIVMGFLALNTGYGLSIFAAVILWFTVIYTAALACSPEVYLSPKILSRLMWPSLGIYRIHIDTHHLTLELTLLGHSQYFEYDLDQISNLSFITDSKALRQKPLTQRYSKVLDQDQSLAIEVNPFSNLKQDEIQKLTQEINNRIRIPVKSPSSRT